MVEGARIARAAPDDRSFFRSLAAEQGERAVSIVLSGTGSDGTLGLRAVEEKAAALRRLADRWDDRFAVMKRDYTQRAAEMDSTAEVLRDLLSGSAP